MSLVFIKKSFSLNECIISEKQGEAFFGPCGPHISLKKAFGNFESMKTFALLIEIYLP
jgi:hypothetical protein